MVPIYSLSQKKCVHRGLCQAKKGPLLLFLLFIYFTIFGKYELVDSVICEYKGGKT